MIRFIFAPIMLITGLAIGQAEATPAAVSLTDLTCILNASDLSLGPDLALQHPASGVQAQPLTLRSKGTAGAANKAWACLDLVGPLYGDGAFYADGISGQVTSKKCGAIIFRANYPSGKAFLYAFCEGKGTGYQELFTLDLQTGGLVLLKNVTWPGGWGAYGGSNPPANCHYRDPSWTPVPGDGAAHQNCQWGRGHVEIQTNTDGSVTVTGRVSLHGVGPATDPSRGVPSGPLSQVGGDLMWTGPLPSGVLPVGHVGLGVLAQAVSSVYPPRTALFSIMGLVADGEPAPGGACE